MQDSKVIVCLSAGDEFYSKAIRNLTRSNVNHAFLAYTSREWGGYYAVQIDARGVVKVPVENVEYSYLECYDFPNLDLSTAMPRVRNMIGDGYDWAGIAGFMVKLYAWRVLGRRVINPLHRSGDLFCSEFVTKYLQRVDGMYNAFAMLDASSVAPGGSPAYLGTPSLQWELQKHDGVELIDCPWRRLST